MPVFLLSPARCDGRRAAIILKPDSALPLALRLRSAEGASLGETFSFLSGLYFRGKLEYARHFGSAPPETPEVLVITTDRGMVPPDMPVRREDLIAFAAVDIATAGARHAEPLRRDAMRLAQSLGGDEPVVLLGSIATAKYADSLLDIFGERLVFPSEFVGRGDMSRGGLLLRCVAEGRELAYVPVAGAVRRGSRPPKLDPDTRPRRSQGQ